MALKVSFPYETIYMSNPLYFSLLLLSILALYLKLIRRGKNKLNLNLPPSPPKLPIIGNLHQLGSLPHKSFAALSKKYGPVMLLQLGKAQTLVISSADMVKEMMKTHDVTFSNRPHTTAAKIFLYGCKDVAFSPYGEYWRQTRKISVLELLSIKRVQLFQYVREEEVHSLVKRLQRASLDGLCVNLSELLLSTSNNVLSRCVLGKKFEDENGNNKYGVLTRQLMEQFTAFSFANFFPALSWIDDVKGLVRQLKATHKEFDVLFDQVIKEHKVKMSLKDHQKCDNQKDFVDILLQLREDGNLGFELTDEDIKAISLDMLVGGSDTSSTSMDWTMAELIRNPTEMKKAQEEIRRVVGKKSKIDINDLNDMECLDCVVKESLRLHPPLPLMVPRETRSSIKNMDGYEIPSKTGVYVNVYAIHRDPNLWENPNDFIPERFMTNAVDFKGQDNFQFIPFGGGRRGCPGLAFAIASVKYVIANLLYRFDWELPDKSVIPEDMNMDESPGLAVTKKVPLHLKPIAYSS